MPDISQASSELEDSTLDRLAKLTEDGEDWLPKAWTQPVPWVGGLRRVKSLAIPDGSGLFFYIDLQALTLHVTFAKNIARMLLRIARRGDPNLVLIATAPATTDAPAKTFMRRFQDAKVGPRTLALTPDVVNYLLTVKSVRR